MPLPFKYFVSFCFLIVSVTASSATNSEVIVDKARDRAIPISISLPAYNEHCSQQTKCPVAFISAGYGIAHTDYQFAVDVFTAKSYLSIAVAHELKNDPALNSNPPYMATRIENWHRGVVTLKFLVDKLSAKYPAYDFSHLTLFGHSNGGDISALYAAIYPNEVSNVITLDHRRMLLPRNKNIRVLTLRGSDYPADRDVLLNSRELVQYPVTQILIAKSRHNDMYDGGPNWLVERMSQEIIQFLQNS
ncbi:alpha/beta hydrolase [Pseudoalteromonas sp. NEC-BIFX-2020_015]|uniref:alpha/beta hydrolase n=1 Tax=Pseudoalteromonas sp. NEC-BIFX-2020_015 TaxID=2729544 RepID=UPI00146143E3|nr:alpha/beta hydrolase [Pseudoalteromonas sp. NEC-BIFX-2020_015]NMR25320.1 alpha/beta hydrolase [Pseudoalteromonas sp. NEC-BIFX-2020_015]